MPTEIPSEFNDHYRSIFGDRWPDLLRALCEGETKIHRKNHFCPQPSSLEISTEFGLSNVYQFRGEAVQRDHETGLLQTYVMDPSSIYGALALAVREGDRVLDMCAAPGGKSLILAEGMGSTGSLIANEMSAGRRSSLIKVIQDYLPMSVRERVFVKGWEAGALGASRRGEFERILLDAPCSGEGHLVQRPQELREWNPGKSKKLALRQYALLTSALEAGAAGARILYSTCTMSPFENDEVIEKLLKKKGERVRVVSETFAGAGVEFAEKTKFGFQYLPDRNGLGPFYFSVLEKK